MPSTPTQLPLVQDFAFLSCRKEAICLHLNALERILRGIRINLLQQTSSSRSEKCCCSPLPAPAAADRQHGCRRAGPGENASWAARVTAQCLHTNCQGQGGNRGSRFCGLVGKSAHKLCWKCRDLLHNKQTSGEQKLLVPPQQSSPELIYPCPQSWPQAQPFDGDLDPWKKWPGAFNIHPAAVSVSLALECVVEVSYLLPNPGALFQVFTSWRVSLQVAMKS